jgi:hypothetical protein
MSFKIVIKTFPSLSNGVSKGAAVSAFFVQEKAQNGITQAKQAPT